MFNLEASIIPGVELGGINLHTHIAVFQRELDLSLASKKITADVRTPSLVSYNFHDTLSIVFDLNNGNVAQLIAKKFYKGFFDDTIGVGSKLDTLLLKGYRLLIDDFEGLIYIKGSPGICFELLDANFLISDLPNQIINQIIIYNPKMDDELLLQSFDEFPSLA